MARRTKFFQHRVVLFRFTSGDGAHTSTGVPTPIEVTRDGILFLGSGSCGVLGEVRISILTRVEPAPGAMQRTGTNHAPGN